MPSAAATHLLEYLVGCGERQTDGSVVVPFGQAELARRLGKSRGTVGNQLRTFGPNVRSDGVRIRIAPGAYAATGTDDRQPPTPGHPPGLEAGADTAVVAAMASWIASNPGSEAVAAVADAISAVASSFDREEPALPEREVPRDLARVLDLDAARPAARSVARQERPVQKVDTSDLDLSELDGSTARGPAARPTDEAARATNRATSRSDRPQVDDSVRAWTDADLERWISRLGQAAAAAGLPAEVQRPRWRPGLVEHLSPFTTDQIDHAVYRLDHQLRSPGNQITNPFGVLCAQAKVADQGYFPAPATIREADSPTPEQQLLCDEAPVDESLVNLWCDDAPPPPPDWALLQVDTLGDDAVAELDAEILEQNQQLVRWPNLRARFPWRDARARVLESRA